MPWTGTHRAFVVENFITIGESVTVTLRNFRTHFHLSRHNPIPDRKSILLWVKNFRDTGSALKRKPSGRQGFLNITGMRNSVYPFNNSRANSVK